MADRTVRVRLEAITAAYEQAMGKAAKATDQLVGKVNGLDSKRLQSLGKDLSTKVTLPMVAAMGLAAKSASDLQQAVGGTEAVFGDAADAINDYAKTAASASGLSEREFREATTSIGGQLKRMTGDVDLAAEQSMKLTGVAADLAATYGGTTAEAVAALGSAFRGEADPAERFNLNLKIGAVNAKAVEMGLAATADEVDDNARAQATLALIMEQSADATGQFARESGSAAGSMQIARAEMENATAELGSALLPALSDVAGGVADIARIFGELPSPVQNAVLALAGLTAAAGPVMSFTGKVMDMNGRLRDSEGGLTRAGKAAKGMGMILGGLGIAAIAIEFHKWAESMSDLNTEARELEGLGLDEVGEKLTDILISAYGSSEGNAPTALVRVREALTELANESPAVVEQLIAVADTAEGDLAAAMELVGLSTDDMRAALEAGVGTQVRVQETQERSTEILDEATGATETNTEATVEAKDAQEELEASIRGVTSAMRAHLDPLWAAQDAFAKHAELQDELKWANIDLLDSGADLADAIKTHGRESDEAAAAWHRQLEAQQKVDKLNGDVVRSALDVADASSELQARVDDGSVSLENAEAQLRLWVEQGIITADQAWATAEQLRGTAGAADQIDGRNIRMTVGVDISQLIDGLAVAAWTVAEFNNKYGTNIATYRGPGVQVEASRASGGPIPGSAGQAVPIMAHGGEFVLSADVVDAIKNGRPTAGLPALAMAGGGGSMTDNSRSVVVNNHYPAPERASDAITRSLRRAQYVN